MATYRIVSFDGGGIRGLLTTTVLERLDAAVYAGVDSDAGANVVDVAMYTSAAPTYFPSVDGYIDGAVAANNPSMAALAQTQDRRAEIVERPTIDELVLLSFGTGAVSNYIVGARQNWGIAQWGGPLINIMIDGVGAVASYQCYQLLRERFQRVQPVLPPNNPIGLDQWQKRDDLVAYGRAHDLDATIAWMQEYWT